jgi:two-component system, OmpR family, sensor kinase
MWVTASTRTNRILLGGWMAFAVVNIWAMYKLPGRETIPFHFVWITLSIVYGFTRWRPWGMVLALVAVAVSTGYILDHHAELGEIGWEETTEVPLMTAVFVAQVWHVHRRQQAVAQAARLAESERLHAETQQLFVRLAAHELRTPITVARGFAELVRKRTHDELIHEDTGIVLEELDKLAQITQRLVTLMQAQGRASAEPIDVDCELTRIGRRWEPTAPRAWRISSTVGYARVDTERLEAAVDCLLENAVKFTDEGDRIELIGRRGHDAWTIEVRDTGAGITAETAAMLSAAEGPLSRTASGTGLGLAIARAVVTAAGGRLTVDGRPGVGAAVTLYFPRRSRDELALSEPVRSAAAER